MNTLAMLLFGAAALSTPFSASAASVEVNDTTSISPDGPADEMISSSLKETDLSELVVTAKRSPIKQNPDRIVYTIKNDPYAKGLNAIELLERIPRISVINDNVSVAGKGTVRYIVDDHLMEMTPESLTMMLRNLQANGIEKIELLTTPPSKYPAGDNVAYIAITTRNESLGTRGNLWARGNYSDMFDYSLGGNVSHTTRRVEITADLGWRDTKGKNDFRKEYIFSDYSRNSDRTTHFNWKTLTANALFRYKFNSRLSAGLIVNYKYGRDKDDVFDLTSDPYSTSISTTSTPGFPNNALTLTGFADWKIDSSGKMLSLTYNRFDRRNSSFSDVMTEWIKPDGDADHQSHLTKNDNNRYGINSVKLDATLPFRTFKMDAGAAYTAIRNNTSLRICDDLNGMMEEDPSQSNHFLYNEKTTALYASAEKNFPGNVFGKIGLRYEHTDIRGIQETDGSQHDSSHNYIFPTALISWNIPGGGRLSTDYSMGISRPSFGDLNPFRYYSTVNEYFTGNPDLKSVITHNVGLNYSYKGLYAVVYGSWNRNAIAYITRFEEDGMQWLTPENCLSTMKTGLYASYNRSLFSWWNLQAGGEVFYSRSTSKAPEFLDTRESSWSGKLELNTSWMLNHSKSLILNLRCTNYFPYESNMVKYQNITILNLELRYMLLNDRLTITGALSDPFSWSVNRSTAHYKDYTLKSRYNIHSHCVSLRIAWSFGGKKVSNPYRDTKERESYRSN